MLYIGTKCPQKEPIALKICNDFQPYLSFSLSLTDAGFYFAFLFFFFVFVYACWRFTPTDPVFPLVPPFVSVDKNFFFSLFERELALLVALQGESSWKGGGLGRHPLESHC